MFAGRFRLAAGFAVAILSLAVAAIASASTAPNVKDVRLTGAYRLERGGWTYVHLQGTPEQIGFQNGYLLASEIADFSHVIKVETKHSTNRDWQFYREAARTILWPHIDREYQQEL